MLAYAAGDAAYLVPLFELLKTRLVELGRLSWVEEECEILSRVRYNAHDDKPLFKRLRGAGSLDRRGLAVAEEILKFRLRLAKKKDRPPFKILGNKSILEMAKSKPSTMDELASIFGLSKGQARSMGPVILKCIEKVMNLKEESLPAYPRKKSKRFSSGVMKKIGDLKAWREGRAKGLGVDPSVVFTNSQIQAVSAARIKTLEELEKVEEVRNWQCAAFGKEICSIMSRRK
jgi:ribonuclease D